MEANQGPPISSDIENQPAARDPPVVDPPPPAPKKVVIGRISKLTIHLFIRTYLITYTNSWIFMPTPIRTYLQEYS